MAFRPLLPYSGQDGWAYLRDTLDAQRAAHDADAPIQTRINLEYFRQKVGGATTAAKLAADDVLVETALAAFGLGKARPSRGFVEAALGADTRDEAAFLKRFGDPRWLELAKAFGYAAREGGKVGEAGFADAVVARHRILAFEESVGAADPSLRRALAFDRAAQGLAAAGFTEAEGWRRALADGATRAVIKGALGLGSSFDAKPPEAQAEAARKAYEALTGKRSVADFAAPEARDRLIRRFLDSEKRASFGSARPSVQGAGMAAFEALERSRDAQQARFDGATRNDPELRHFAKAAPLAVTVDAFVADERLVATALEAFGLSAAKPTAAFMRSVLASDTANRSSFANAQADPRWAEMARAFGFGDARGPQVEEFGFAEDIAARVRVNRFDEAVGAQNDTLRLGLIFDRAIETLANAGLSREEGWTRALGHGAVGWVLQQALDLPRDFATLRPSAQNEAIRAAAKAATGSDRIDAFAAEGARDALLRRYFAAEAAEARARPVGLGDPVIPVGGVAGWRFLQRTLADQQARFAQSAETMRETRYFRENIGRIDSAKELVADRRLLTVALTAFGLEAETDKRAFIERALTEGSENPRALAVRLVDTRYREFAAAFGFGDAAGARTGLDGFAETIVARYETRAFEAAVGEQDESLRLALTFDRQAESLAAQNPSGDVGWFRLLGDVPTRRVLEGALGLPSSFAQIEIETQVATVKSRVRGVTGREGFGALADRASRDKLVTGFLFRAEITASGATLTRGASALTLLQSGRGAGGLLNLRS